jgi:hypothetical protein
MSRTAALWISAILTLAFVLIVGTTLLRSGASHSATAQSQPATTTLDAGSRQLSPLEQPVVGEYQGDQHDDHEDSDHHEHNEEHDDDD